MTSRLTYLIRFYVAIRRCETVFVAEERNTSTQQKTRDTNGAATSTENSDSSPVKCGVDISPPQAWADGHRILVLGNGEGFHVHARYQNTVGVNAANIRNGHVATSEHGELHFLFNNASQARRQLICVRGSKDTRWTEPRPRGPWHYERQP